MLRRIPDAAPFFGYQGDVEAPTAILLVHRGLHIEIRIDAATSIGTSYPAHVTDVTLEAAVSTIIDCEESVAVVNVTDRVALYRN